MARYKKRARSKRSYTNKKKYYRRKYKKSYKKKGMQRIKTVKWPVKNIGGDRARTKLRYVIGSANFSIPTSASSAVQNMAFNLGAWSASPLQTLSINGILGSTPGLSTMGAQYQHYRIKGVALKLTYWQTAGDPVCLFTNASGDTSDNTTTDTGPVPPFVAPNISVLPEQRWAKYRTCQMTQNGGKATSLSVYYSVNRVYGPDNVVKNSTDFIGGMQPATPYFDPTAAPRKSPWLQYGIFTLSGANPATAVAGVLKAQATVYCEFFGKRYLTE